MRAFIFGEHLNVLVVDHDDTREVNDLRFLQRRRDLGLNLIRKNRLELLQLLQCFRVLLDRQCKIERMRHFEPPENTITGLIMNSSTS
jgi:hypothetical protein